ncbi:hypothetical protein SCYAM73S_03356 [Streptomyces cyaneofuscatus]
MARQPQDLLHLLTRAERLAARRIQSVLDAYDCSVDAWRVLDPLSGDEGRGMTALAEDAALPAPTLTKLIDQLVDQNVVFRRVDPADRRRVLVQLTPGDYGGGVSSPVRYGRSGDRRPRGSRRTRRIS